MKTYIWKNIRGYYVEYPEEIDANYWEGQIGETFQDFLDGKWVLLSDEQVAFHNEHPNATVSQVLSTELPVEPVRTIEQAKAEKKAQINDFDSSNAVNSFSINGNDMWLSVEERQQIATQINANEAAGRENMTRWFNGVSFTFPLNTWKQMLTALEIYAGDALNVTESHKASVDALDSIEAVDSYDYTVGYPTKLVF